MNELIIFNNQKETINNIRDSLKTVPIIYGDVVIDWLYRKHDTKDKLVNYAEISFLRVNSEHYHSTCRLDKYKGLIDIYSSNEIMSQRLAFALAEKINNSQITPTLWLQECVVEQVYELDKGKYVSRLSFLLVM